MIRRPYQDRELAGLQRAVQAWTAEAGPRGYDHSGELPHRIYENLRGRRPVGDLVHVWSDGPEVVGVSIALRFGCAFDVVLAPGLRGTPAERELLEDAGRTTARYLAAGEEYVNTDVFSGDHTRAAALRSLGFERYRVWDHVRERSLDEPVEESTVDGFRIRPATPADADELAAARNGSFDETWTGETYRAEVMAKPGYDPEREIVAVAPDGRVAAYTVYWVDADNGRGHIEPLGTHRDFRRLGLGAAVLRHALGRMRAAGLASVSVNHAADNAPAARLYESLGFTVVDETHGYRISPG